MAYVHQHFPKWVYSATEQPRIVASQEELEALAGEWFSRPDLVERVAGNDEAAPKKKGKK